MRETEYTDFTGQKIDNYQIEELLAFHKVSVRYLARTDADEPVFLEVLNAASREGSDLAKRFRKHMHVLTQLKHPNIAPISPINHTSDNLFYAAFPPLSGATLAQKLAEWRETNFPSAQEALTLVRQLATALAAVQPAGVIHYDLRPENIILREDYTPVLMDLGIPLAISVKPIKQDATHTPKLDHASPMLDYASPEQLFGEQPDERSNIYSLGIILYELLAGHRPQLPSSSWDIFDRVSLPKERPLEEAKPGLAVETYELIKMCLWRQPWNRFESLNDLIKAIDTALLAEEQKPLRSKADSRTLPWHYAAIPLLIIVVLAGIFWTSRDSRMDAITPLPATAVPVNIPAITLPVAPTVTLIPTPLIVEEKILSLAPSPNAEFTENDTIHFDWYWPTILEPDQRFSVQLFVDGEWRSVGTVDRPAIGSQYRLSVEVVDLALPAGNYLWFVVLTANEDEENLFPSERQSFTVLISAPAATILPTATPTQDGISATETRLASCVPSSPRGWVIYTVQQNDYLFNLALDRGTTVARLQEVNCLDGPALGVGMRLWLPNLPATETPTIEPTSETPVTPVSNPSNPSNPTAPAATKTPPPPPT